MQPELSAGAVPSLVCPCTAEAYLNALICLDVMVSVQSVVAGGALLQAIAFLRALSEKGQQWIQSVAQLMVAGACARAWVSVPATCSYQPSNSTDFDSLSSTIERGRYLLSVSLALMDRLWSSLQSFSDPSNICILRISDEQG